MSSNLLKGRIAELLARATPREDQTPLEFTPRPVPMALDGVEERALVLLGVSLLEQLQGFGGARVRAQALEAIATRAQRGLKPQELMDVEVELYELLHWLGHALNPELSRELDPVPEFINEDTPSIDVIRWAMSHGDDVQMTYYHPQRGELTSRRVTPLELRAETYILAFCHLRSDERVFRISRIGEAAPASGWPTHELGVHAPEVPIDVVVRDLDEQERAHIPPSQMTFFGEEE